MESGFFIDIQWGNADRLAIIPARMLERLEASRSEADKDTVVHNTVSWITVV